MDFTIELKGSISFDKVNYLLQKLTYNISVPIIHLDLTNVTFMDTAGMTLLTAYLNYMRNASIKAGKEIRFFTTRPNSDDVHRYLLRMNFYENIGIDLDRDFKARDGSGNFKEVLIIQNERESNSVSEELIKILENQTKIDDVFLRILRYSVTEIAENIFHHANSPIGGVVCAQTYPDAQKVQISIIDTGMGIPHNIRTISGYEKFDDKTALEKAVQLRVTSTPERNSGQGLFFSSQITVLNGGAFTIHSLNGSICMNQKSGPVLKASPLWHGTAVIFELPMNLNFSLKQLMDKYYPPDNDFKFIKEI